jgi:Arc/MetJ family transcription regulator
MVRTNIVLDDDLVAEAIARTGVKSKRAVVDLALRELVRNRRKKSLIDLSGRIELAEGYDYRKLRRTRRDPG